MYITEIVQEFGLGITLYDIHKATSSKIRLHNGAASFDLTFRLVVFRPLIGEVILGTLRSSEE